MAVSNLEVQCKSFTTFKDGQYLIAAPFDLFLVALFFLQLNSDDLLNDKLHAYEQV